MASIHALKRFRETNRCTNFLGLLPAFGGGLLPEQTFHDLKTMGATSPEPALDHCQPLAFLLGGWMTHLVWNFFAHSIGDLGGGV